jgi:hypothetical protein
MEPNYPSHLSDERRLEVAVSYVQHELRKLFPSLRSDTDFAAIDGDVARWFSGNPNFAPVRDFWNGLHGISRGFKLKDLVTTLTSRNVVWERRLMPVKEIRFYAPIVHLAAIGKNPTAAAVADWYFSAEHAAELSEARANLKLHGEDTAPRDSQPIIVLKTLDYGTVLLDGNRRLLKAVLEQQPTIEAFIGTQLSSPLVLDQWVPTSTLKDIISVCRNHGGSSNPVSPFASVLATMVKNSTAGQYELFNRCLNQPDPIDQQIAEEVTKLLNSK